jgi:hypothetical protein
MTLFFGQSLCCTERVLDIDYGHQPHLKYSYIHMSTTSLLSTTTTKHQPTLPTHPTIPLPKSITMAPDRRGKVTRNIPLESSLVNLGVSETEVHKLTREEQSAKYNSLIQQVASIERLCCLCGGREL